jgi:hypothetical protein
LRRKEEKTIVKEESGWDQTRPERSYNNLLTQTEKKYSGKKLGHAVLILLCWKAWLL